MRLSAFIFFVIGIMASCSNGSISKEKVVITNVSEKVTSTFPNGKTQSKEIVQHDQNDSTWVLYQEYHPTGKLKISGRLNLNKQREGLWEAFYDNGNKWSEGVYINGVENGQKIVWYENGKKRYEGQIKDGKSVGEWTFWDEKGKRTHQQFNP